MHGDRSRPVARSLQPANISYEINYRTSYAENPLNWGLFTLKAGFGRWLPSGEGCTRYFVCRRAGSSNGPVPPMIVLFKLQFSIIHVIFSRLQMEKWEATLTKMYDEPPFRGWRGGEWSGVKFFLSLLNCGSCVTGSQLYSSPSGAPGLKSRGLISGSTLIGWRSCGHT